MEIVLDKKDNNYILMWAKKIKAIDLLGGECSKCGESDIFKICFHHKDPNIKESYIRDLRGCRWSTLKKEIEKCSLLCHNCHIEHHDRGVSTKHKLNKQLYLQYKNKFECSICKYSKSYNRKKT